LGEVVRHFSQFFFACAEKEIATKERKEFQLEEFSFLNFSLCVFFAFFAVKCFSFLFFAVNFLK